MNTTLKIIIWIVVLGAIAYAIYYFYNKSKEVTIPNPLPLSIVPNPYNPT